MKTIVFIVLSAIIYGLYNSGLRDLALGLVLSMLIGAGLYQFAHRARYGTWFEEEK